MHMVLLMHMLLINEYTLYFEKEREMKEHVLDV